MIEQTIFANLLYNEPFNKLALPHLKDEYFKDTPHKISYDLINTFVNKYGKQPSKEALLIDLANVSGFRENDIDSAAKFINDLEIDNTTDDQWLVETTEKYCQDAAIYNALMKSVGIVDGSDKDNAPGAIPEILSAALSISFDNSIGHDFFEDAEKQFDYYHTVESRIAFDLAYLNKITGGGLKRKTLSLIMAGTNVGKSMLMCHMASANLSLGLNVLYITMEMSEAETIQRIDANLMDTRMGDVEIMTKDVYLKKHKKIKEKSKGRLIVKEYPTASAGAGHFKALLQELKVKSRFTPDIIYIDYLNICCSSRMTMGQSGGSYGYVKAISEELRGLAMEHNLPIVSATQTNREGYDSSDMSLTNMSESFGTAMTVDFCIGISQSPELEEQGLIEVQQLKNRGNDVSYYRRFVIGVDKHKMKFFDAEEQDRDDYTENPGHKDDDKPLFDNSGFGSRAAEDDSMKYVTKKAGRKDYSGLS